MLQGVIWIRRMILAMAGAAFLGSLLVLGLFWHYSRDLPDLAALESYNPPQINRISAADGSLLGEFGEQRRTLVAEDEIPQLMLDAIVASEDALFYQHPGVDFFGIMRAVIRNTLALRISQGASTITQQVMKNLLLSHDRKLSRKIKEAILAWRIEQNISKRKILYIYANEVYFGNGCYGIYEAARFYFNKKLAELNTGEIAYIAGLLQSPNGYALNRHPEKAKKRQRYVLRRLLDLKYITRVEWERYDAAELIYSPPPGTSKAAAYAVDAVRAKLNGIIDEKPIKAGGLRIATNIDPELQNNARRALRKNLLAYDRRHGYRPLPIADEDARKLWVDLVRKEEKRRNSRVERSIFAFSADHAQSPIDSNELSPDNMDSLFWHTLVRRMDDEGLYYGFIEDVSSKGLRVRLGTSIGSISMKEAGWAIARGRKLVETFRTGQVVVVTVKSFPENQDTILPLSLSQIPEAQSAIVAIDPADRSVRAIVGGFSYWTSNYNRAVSAMRQPGSSFKPFLYLTALRQKKYTAASIIVDEPVTFPSGPHQNWSPKNFNGKFRGAMRLRLALANSVNTVAAKLIFDIGPESVIETAHGLGIRSELKPYLTLSLGSSEVTVMEMVNAYSSLASGGIYDEQALIESVIDSQGHVLYRRSPAPKRVISEAECALIVSLMRSVVEEGTSVRARSLGRQVAGKTGTTNDQRDAWFVGYSPGLAAGVWVGYDEDRVLGWGETGARAALPAWIDFMAVAHENTDVEAFPTSGLVHAWVNEESGLRVPAPGPGAIEEVFLEGTLPEWEEAEKVLERNDR